MRIRYLAPFRPPEQHVVTAPGESHGRQAVRCVRPHAPLAPRRRERPARWRCRPARSGWAGGGSGAQSRPRLQADQGSAAAPALSAASPRPQPVASALCRVHGRHLRRSLRQLEQQLRPAVRCPCPAGKTCLGSGSCAQICTDHPQCPTGCFCGAPSVEGPRPCAPSSGATCDQLQTPCTSTTQCPVGAYCLPVPCGSGGAAVNRCLPLGPS